MNRLTIFFLTSALLVAGGGCSSTPPPAKKADIELSRTALSARRTFDQGQIEGAARLYTRALERARSTDNSAEIANNAYNLALCLVRLGKFEESLPYIEEARAEFKRQGVDLTNILLSLLEAKTDYLMGRREEAGAIAARELERGESLPAAARLQFHVLQAWIALDGNHLPDARQGLKLAENDLEAAGSDPLLKAETAGLWGAILIVENQPGEAAKAFDRQAALLREGEKYAEMADALGEAGGAWRRSGDHAAAAERYFRAARSFFGQGDTVRALKMIEAALAAMEDGEANEDLLERIVGLFDEIKQSVPSPSTSE